MQDAFVAAAVEWDRRGVPDRPGAWLTTTAWRKALDRLRHERVAGCPCRRPCGTRELRPRPRLRSLVAGGRPAASGVHLLPSRARAGGADGADAAQRRRADRARDRPRVPVERGSDGAAAHPGAPEDHRGRGSRSACRRTSGCRSGSRASLRVDLPRLHRGAGRRCAATSATEAIRLARLLARLMPDERRGARAARAAAAHRRAAGGARRRTARWSRSRSRTARAGTRRRSRRDPRPSTGRCACGGRGRTWSRRRSPRCTRRRRRFEATDWPQIAGLYAELERLDPSPVVTINRAVAVAFARGRPRRPRGPRRGSTTRASTATSRCTPRAPSCCVARATSEGADAAYARAIALSDSEPQRAALERRRQR